MVPCDLRVAPPKVQRCDLGWGAELFPFVAGRRQFDERGQARRTVARPGQLDSLHVGERVGEPLRPVAADERLVAPGRQLGGDVVDRPELVVAAALETARNRL